MSDDAIIAAFAEPPQRSPSLPLATAGSRAARDLDRAFRLQCGGDAANWAGRKPAGRSAAPVGARPEGAECARALFPAPCSPTASSVRRPCADDRRRTSAWWNRRWPSPWRSRLPPRGDALRRGRRDGGGGACVHAAIEVVNPRTPKGFADAVPWFVVDGGLNDGDRAGRGAEAACTRDALCLASRAEVSVERPRHAGRCRRNALGGGDLALTWLANHLNGAWRGPEGRRHHHHRRDHRILLGCSWRRDRGFLRRPRARSRCGSDQRSLSKGFFPPRRLKRMGTPQSSKSLRRPFIR